MIAAAIGGAALLAVLITVAAELSARKPSPRAPQAAQPQEEAVTVDISELLIPPEFGAAWAEHWIPSRPRMRQWTEEQVRGFWIDPRAASLDALSAENDAKLRELFRTAP